ncbi:MAG: twin arginine-targeting protein translocase TatC [Omnitrophica WOR_2 bacterium RBG_13_44_8b]|nr:MAG: twin arginine-targeting protein translocase TatC [Omnitrophica WOR_2 bacterium RBG_13_44_8b]
MHIDHELTLVEHLDELRKRLILCLVMLGLCTAFSLPFVPSVLKILKLPASGLIGKLTFFGPQEAFLIYMNIGFFCGLIISMPIILHQLWAFILPALEDRLKNRIGLFIVFCSASFITGCLFAFFFLIPPALKFLLNFGKDELEPVISAQRYISFVISLTLACGFVFQMPVLSLILTKIGILHHYVLRKKYKYAVVIIFVIAAIITPTADAFNMLMLTFPMLFLYELSIWVSFYARHKST